MLQIITCIEKKSIDTVIILNPIYLLCVFICVLKICVAVNGQFAGVGPVFPWCGFQGPNSDMEEASLPTDPSCQP